MPTKQKLIDKMKAIGVRDALIRRWETNKFTLPEQALWAQLMAGGVHEAFALRAIQRGLTDNDIMWNQRLGRPVHFVEGDREVEAERREEWTRRHPPVPGVP